MHTQVTNAEATHDFLRSPKAYPDCPDRVELRETHISWVYLTKRFAYKQKKPVRFEFLDFSTPDRRRQACEQEVLLNRRLASDVYLGVVPVRKLPSGLLSLDGEGEVVDWLVKMKRLDEDTSLQSILSRDEDPDVRGIANRLVEFYVAQPPAVVMAREFRETLHRHVVANQEALLQLAPDHQDVVRFVSSAQQRYLTLAAEQFDRRACDGRIVDGHGDLRPDHVFATGAQVQVIDCIEFNQEYRQNDILDEFAFLKMECERLGHAAVGESILNAYLAAGRDVPPTQHVDFYICYRACVRAKIAALRLASATSDHKLSEVKSYLEIARQHAEQLGPRLVFLVGGMMGSGKSTLAQALAEPLAAELIQTDALRERLLGPGDAPYGHGKYSEGGRESVYREMERRMIESLRWAPTVILDGMFPRLSLRKSMMAAVEGMGVRVIQVQCDCSRKKALERIERRSQLHESASQAKVEHYDRAVGEYETPTGTDVIHIDTKQSIGAEVHELLKELRCLF